MSSFFPLCLRTPISLAISTAGLHNDKRLQLHLIPVMFGNEGEGLMRQDHSQSGAGPQPRWLLHVEAANFDACLFDVDDLSAIRGGSEAMLVLPRLIIERLGDALGAAAEVKMVFSAASQGLATISGKSPPLAESAIRDKLETLLGQCDAQAANAARLAALSSTSGQPEIDALIPHLIPILTWKFGLVPLDGSDANAMRAAAAAKARSQLRRLSVDIPPFGPLDGAAVDTTRPCFHDWVRPRNVRHFMPRAAETDNDDDLSLSLALRRTLGRTARRSQFYRRATDGCGDWTIEHGFAHDFSELVEQPPHGVPDIVANKIAIIWMDANGLGAHRNELVTDLASATAFSDAIMLHRSLFLRALVDWAATQPFLLLTNPQRQQVDSQARTLPVLRLETLLWGADEMMFAMPAWALQPVLGKLEELLGKAHWNIGLNGQESILTHAVGIAIASAKAPIRLLKSLASDLADEAKVAGREANRWQYFISGTIDMPTRSLRRERHELFRCGTGDDAAKAFTLPLDGAEQGLACLAAIKGESGNRDVGLPRNKLAEALGQLTLSQAQLGPKDVLADLLGKGDYRDVRNGSLSADTLFDNVLLKLSSTSVTYAPLIHILQLWPLIALDLSDPASRPAEVIDNPAEEPV